MRFRNALLFVGTLAAAGTAAAAAAAVQDCAPTHNASLAEDRKILTPANSQPRPPLSFDGSRGEALDVPRVSPLISTLLSGQDRGQRNRGKLSTHDRDQLAAALYDSWDPELADQLGLSEGGATELERQLSWLRETLGSCSTSSPESSPGQGNRIKT